MGLKQDILATLSYFDIFDYPLTQAEILRFSGNACTHEEISEALHHLTVHNWVYKFDEFYSLQDDRQLVYRRRQGNIRARQMLKTAEKLAGFLSAFPFVRGVAVSGSLSKNYAGENSDIDFFIITKKNKLWLARTFMHLFKKLTFLAKKQHWFCMNYYIDEEMLQIREKNIYTATEVLTLLPLRGIEAFNRFYAENKWSRDFLPNHSLKISYVEEVKNPILKKIVESLLNNSLGNVLDHYLQKITTSRWRKKTKKKRLNSRGVLMGMDASRHYAKPDPKHFQEKLLQLYEKKIYHLFRMYESRAKTIN